MDFSTQTAIRRQESECLRGCLKNATGRDRPPGGPRECLANDGRWSDLPALHRITHSHPIRLTVAENGPCHFSDCHSLGSIAKFHDPANAVVHGETHIPPAQDSAEDAFGVLRPHCRARIAHYKAPRRIELVPALPRNATGKVLKQELREQYWEGRERRIG